MCSEKYLDFPALGGEMKTVYWLLGMIRSSLPVQGEQ
jgi:hypothetical protein